MNKGKLDFSLGHNQNIKKEKKKRQTESQNKTFVIKKSEDTNREPLRYYSCTPNEPNSSVTEIKELIHSQ